MALDMLMTMSFVVVNTPDISPYTTPGIRKTINIRGTMDRINGAAREVISPLASRHAELSGAAQKKRPTKLNNMTEVAVNNALFSLWTSGSMVGFSSSSTDMATFFRRGAMTLSVRYQPTVTLSNDEAEVQAQL